jgi:hypothetical protein
MMVGGGYKPQAVMGHNHGMRPANVTTNRAETHIRSVPLSLLPGTHRKSSQSKSQSHTFTATHARVRPVHPPGTIGLCPAHGATPHHYTHQVR